MYRYAALFGLLFLSACFLSRKSTTTTTATAVAARKKTIPFRYGSPRDEILAQITDRSELMIAEFNYPQGHLVTYQYARFGKAGYKTSRYYLYFMNDTLIRKSGEEDVVQGARKAIAEYYRADNED